MKGKFYNQCVICKRMFFSDTRHRKTCATCKASHKLPATVEPFPWDDEERQAPTPPEAA
ncbi:MAG: hypothetical protein AB9903_12970 [Vulcanimicrobiota bacterium]